MAGRLSTQHLDIVQAIKQSYPEGELRDVLVEYIEESEHAGWDGFTGRDLYGVRRFLTDLGVYIENRG